MYQESYDNSGLIVGNANADIKGVMLCLDSTEAVLDEAIEKGCNVVVAHHPIVFKGLKRITGRSYVERVIIKAIKNDERYKNKWITSYLHRDRGKEFDKLQIFFYKTSSHNLKETPIWNW